MLLPSIVGAVVPDSPIRGTLVLTSRRPRGSPSKPCFLFLLSTSYPCPMQCTLTHFSCRTGHTTYSPEGGVHNNTCRGSSKSTIQVAGASCCQPVADDIIHLQSGSPFRPKRAVSSVPFTRLLFHRYLALKPSHQPSAMAAPRTSSYICHAAK